MQKFKGKVGGIKVHVVDTTGAGDAFCAGLLSNLAKDFDIIEVSKWFSTQAETLNSSCYSNSLTFISSGYPFLQPIWPN